MALPRETERPREKPKVLLVDDNQEIRKLIPRVLGGEYDVLVAKDDLEAKRLLEKHGGLPVVSDVSYPDGGLDGLHRWIRDHSNKGIRNSAILAISAMDFEKLKRFGESRGIEVLSKPFEMEEFMNKVAQLVLKHQTQQ